MATEVLEGFDVGGDINTGLENHLSGIIPWGGEVETEAVFLLYLEVVKDQVTKLIKGEVSRLRSLLVI